MRQPRLDRVTRLKSDDRSAVTKRGCEQWVGAYYPNEMMEDSRARAILCLLFDKVVCHFPISDMACGGGSGMSECFSDEPLVKAGVVEVIEEVLLPEVEVSFSPGYYWGTEEEFDQFCRLQITAMAMNTCAHGGFVPITDDPDWPIPASLTQKIDLARFAQFHAAALAVRSLGIALPPIADLSDEDILQARDELREQLAPFRNSMLVLSPLVRDGIQSGITLAEIYEEAKYVVDTKVAPAIFELQVRLSKEKGRFWRRLIIKSGAVIPKFVVSWTTKNALSAVVDGLSDTKDLAIDFMEHEKLLNSLKTQGGLGYLLSVSDNLSTKSKKKNRVSANIH